MEENDIIACPKCKEFQTQSNSSLVEEYSKNVCKICGNDFCFILCEYCNRKIYMRIQSQCEYNGLLGFNIQCCYKDCKGIFYLTKCINCQKLQKQKVDKIVEEGDLITCIDCGITYIQLNCPEAYCQDLLSQQIVGKKETYQNGMMIIHKNILSGQKTLYQKINCVYCLKPIVYRSEKSKINKYYEGQIVVCPYKDCGKKFNRLMCPLCNTYLFIKEGFYLMGRKIKCLNCDNCFSKMVCPSCLKVNTKINAHFNEVLFKCSECNRKIYIINCVRCRKPNYFPKKIPKYGQKIICGYCNEGFKIIECYKCKRIKYFPLLEFSFGKLYNCQMCKEIFQYFICPNCLSSNISTEAKEGKTIHCLDCKISFMNFGCPFCKENILFIPDSFIFGKLIKCPNKSCEKYFSFSKCQKCQRLIYSKECQYLDGVCVKCEYCKSYTLRYQCPLCKKKIIFNGQTSDLKEGEEIECHECKKKFEFKQNKEICSDNLSILEEIKGHTINFGIGEEDKNYKIKLDLFFETPLFSSIFPNKSLLSDSSVLYRSNTLSYIRKREMECIQCHNNLKESVFFPCGHRCTCFECANNVYYFDKKCPKCNTIIKCVIKKVFG